jgi:hypothetical protein
LLSQKSLVPHSPNAPITTSGTTNETAALTGVDTYSFSNGFPYFSPQALVPIPGYSGKYRGNNGFARR